MDWEEEKRNRVVNPEFIRNVGIVAHIDAGKTTLTERILYATRVIRVMGDVHEGTAVTDWTRQERERGISINAAAVNCQWKRWHINLVDTPGHVDFTAEVERSLCVMDGVVAVFCAVKGVQAQSETVWRCAVRHKLPALAFVNKMDREGADGDGVVEQICQRLHVAAVPVEYPLGSGSDFMGTVDLLTGEFTGKGRPDLSPYRDDVEIAREYLVECLAEVDDGILHEYLSGIRPSAESLCYALRRAVAARSIMPVFFGSSLRNQGVENLLDGIGNYLPSPGEAPERLLSCRSSHTGVMVFRVVPAHDGAGRLAYARVCSGAVHTGLRLRNPRNAAVEELAEVLKIQANDAVGIASAVAGDIVALRGEWLKVRTGDVFSDDPEVVKLEKLTFPQPVVSLNIAAVDTGRSRELGQRLKTMSREDPTLRVKPIAGSLAWTVSGMGELHLEVVRERLAGDFGLLTKSGEPRVEFMESIVEASEEDFLFERRFPNGTSIRAAVHLAVKPLPRGEGVKLNLAQLNGVLQENLVHAVKQGLLNIVNAENSGFPLTDICVTVLSADCQPLSAGEAALISAARAALENALAKAGRITLEPVMRIEVTTPGDFLGSVVSDLNARRASISQIDAMSMGQAKIVAMAPLAELFGYASSLRSMSAGRGEVVAEPAFYGVRATH